MKPTIELVMKPLVPRIVAITTPDHDEKACLDFVRALFDAGWPAVLIRSFSLTAKSLYSIAEAASNAFPNNLVLISDRADIAAAAGCGGVHLPWSGLEPGDARKTVGPDALVGVSCHSMDQVMAAESGGADYVFLSPVFRTSSHPERLPMGLTEFSRITRAVRIPVIGLGGIDSKNAKDVTAAGAYGLAVKSFATDPARISELLEAVCHH